MFGRKKEAPKPTGRRRTDGLSKYGLLDIPGVDDTGFGINDNDEDDDAALEAELLALTSGSTPVRPRKKPTPPAPTVNLDAMVAESLRDVPSDEEGSIDENDPALLNELTDLIDDGGDDDEPAVEDSPSPKSSEQKHSGNTLLVLLQERLKMYEAAEKNAKSSGEGVRARRFSRGIKTLNGMIKQASAGRVINEEDIPPLVVVTGSSKPTAPETPSGPGADAPAPLAPARRAPPPPVPEKSEINTLSPVDPSPDISSDYIAPIGDSEPEPVPTDAQPTEPTVEVILKQRQSEYKTAALQAKRQGNTEQALKYIKIVKQFETVIAAAASGQPVDMTTVPPPPGAVDVTLPMSVSSPKTEAGQQKSGDDALRSVGEAAEMMAAAAEAAEGEGPADETLFDAPPAPTTVLEALEQRLAKYKSSEQAAKEEGNSSKIRRLGRIVKQYEGAIKLHKAGKPIPVDELPTPPGFGPIPVEGSGPSAPDTAPQPVPTPAAVQPVPTRATPVTPAPTTVSEPSAEGTSSITPKANIRKSPQSRQEKQLSLLLIRQKKFKEAAIEAKKTGEINQAKEYLRLAKGFDPLIEASQNGLPVDLATIPVPPDNKKELESDFDVVTLEDCIPGSDAEIYEKLEQDLLRQTKMCLTTRDHFKATGDIASANRFEQLAVHSKKDLDAVKCAHKRSDPVPKFHYETRSFNIVQCCTELGDNDLELSIVQGINYNVPNPKDVDTYVKFEFPYPTETPVKDRTGLIKDTNNPQYNQTFMLAIQRNVRACQRIFKRQAIKLEVWSRGGFFRSDALIGTATLKLLPLETKCVIHDAFDLMEGRRAVGGKLEVKVRVRNPILTKQVEQVQEKWLVIDQYI